MLQAATAVTKATGLTNAITQEVQLRTTSIRAADDLELRNQRGVDRPSTLDTDITNNAANGNHLVDAAALAGDQGSREDLDTFFLTFNNSDVNVDGIADIETRDIRFQSFGVHGFDEFLRVHKSILWCAGTCRRAPRLGRGSALVEPEMRS
jgi:hypothetical protein